MIKIEMPLPDIVLLKSSMQGLSKKPAISSKYNFIDYEELPRFEGGIYVLYKEDECLYVGQTNKFRKRMRRHFDSVKFPMVQCKEEVDRIVAFIVDDPVERDIYEIHLINKLQAKYNKKNSHFRKVINNGSKSKQ